MQVLAEGREISPRRHGEQKEKMRYPTVLVIEVLIAGLWKEADVTGPRMNCVGGFGRCRYLRRGILHFGWNAMSAGLENETDEVLCWSLCRRFGAYVFPVESLLSRIFVQVSRRQTVVMRFQSLAFQERTFVSRIQKSIRCRLVLMFNGLRPIRLDQWAIDR